jgi:Spy/CpxP family protein refolding chaperone
MDIFSQKKFLTRVILFLVMLNLLSVGFFVWKSVYHHEPLLFLKNEDYKNVSGILKKELNLDEKQVSELNEIRERYYLKEIDLKKTIKDFKDEMNEKMFNKNTDETKIKILAKQIADSEYQMELLRFEQAKELKSICNAEQQEKFEKLVKEIRDYFRPDNQPNKR